MRNIGSGAKSTRISYGVACCRVNSGGGVEMVLVCKRYTYAFNVFVHGKYNPTDGAELLRLFSGMTVDEKLDILSLNFSTMWYRVWLNCDVRKTNYFYAKSKFENAFVCDGGVRLRKIISRSANSQRVWEIPKGKKKNREESDIQCAVREFREETGLAKSSYKIFPMSKVRYSYIDEGVRYVNIYYVGIMKKHTQLRVNFTLQCQIDEISDIQWAGIEKMRMLNMHLAGVGRSVFSFAKKQMKT